MSDGNTAELWVPTGSVTVRVPGKVNLYLAVGDRREDGYHELTTVFQAVSLLDEVTVRNADVLSLEVVGEGPTSCPPTNATSPGRRPSGWPNTWVGHPMFRS